MIDESPNIIKLKSRNIFNEIREKVKPITATEEKQDKKVEGQESIEEILSDIFDEVCQRTHAFKKREHGFSSKIGETGRKSKRKRSAPSSSLPAFSGSWQPI